MHRHTHARFASALAALSIGALAAIPARGAKPNLSSATAAQRVIAKWRQIMTTEDGARGPLKPVVLTETEANSYLQTDGRQILPPGIYNPHLHIASNYVWGSAVVDFNQLNRKQGQSATGLGVLAWLFSGRQFVTAEGKLQTGNRTCRLTFQNVHIGTTTLSDWLVNWVLQYYVESKYKIDLSKPFALPGDVTAIVLMPGKAIFVRAPKPFRKTR